MKRVLFPLALALGATPAFADGERFGHMMDWGYGAGILFGPVLWLLVLGLVVAGVVWFVGQSGLSQPRSDAAAILDRRLANGEIDADEYTARKTLLNS